MTPTPRLPFLLVIVALLACGGRPTQLGARPDAADREAEAAELAAIAPVYLTVQNGFALPVEIYAIGSGITQRLGTVHPGMTGRYTLPKNLTVSGPVELVADAGQNQRFRSVSQLLPPGAVVTLEVSSQIFNSRLDVRP